METVFNEILGDCTEDHFDQNLCYPTVMEFSQDFDTVSYSGTFIMIEEQEVITDDMSDHASSVGTVKTDDSSSTTMSSKSRKMRLGWQFIMDNKGTENAKMALAALKATQLLDNIRENEHSLNDPSSGASESAASSSRATSSQRFKKSIRNSLEVFPLACPWIS